MRRSQQTISLLVLLALFLLVAAALAPGCKESGIPVFEPKARLLNRVASAEELLIEVNHEVGQARRDGLINQGDIDRLISPSLRKAEQIIKATREVARATATQPATTRPAGTIDDVRQLLLGVRSIIEQVRGGNTT
jgi:hypothetical protein